MIDFNAYSPVGETPDALNSVPVLSKLFWTLKSGSFLSVIRPGDERWEGSDSRFLEIIKMDLMSQDCRRFVPEFCALAQDGPRIVSGLSQDSTFSGSAMDFAGTIRRQRLDGLPFVCPYCPRIV